MDERLSKLGSKIRRIEVESSGKGMKVHLYTLDQNRRLQRSTGTGETYQEALSDALDALDA